MSALTRVTQKIFAVNAPSTQIGKFGSLAAGSPATTNDPSLIQSLSEFTSGWFSAVLGVNSPSIEDMNALFFLIYRQIAYVFERGIPEWDSGTAYYIGSTVSSGTTVYVSTANNNLNNAVTNQAFWSVLASGGFSVLTKITNYTLTIADDVILANGKLNLTLPLASTVKKTFRVKNIGSGSVKIITSGSDKIDGESSLTLSETGVTVELISDTVSGFYVF